MLAGICLYLLATWGNAARSRDILRQHIETLRNALPSGWHLALASVTGGIADSRVDLRLLGSPNAVALTAEVGFCHHFFSTRWHGELAIADPRQRVAALRGQYALAWPALTLEWQASITGLALESGADASSAWTISPWQIELSGDAAEAQARFDSDGFSSGAADWSFSNAHLDLSLRTMPEPTAEQAQALLSLDRLRYRTVLASGVLLQAQAQTTPSPWPLRLTAQADELLNTGVPFVRLSAPDYQLSGSLSAGDGAASNWQSEHQLAADSNYGQMSLSARIAGSGNAHTGWRMHHIALDGRVPASLWDLLQRLYPQLGERLLQQGQAQRDASHYRFSAVLLDSRDGNPNVSQ
jgi:hypothetical protein